MITVDGLGQAVGSPVSSGDEIRLTLAKHLSTDRFRRCWVSVLGRTIVDLTDRCVEEDESVFVDVVAGVDLEAGGTDPVFNVVHFTTSVCGHTKAGIWVS